MENRKLKSKGTKFISYILLLMFLAYSLLALFNSDVYAISQSISSDYTLLNDSEYPGIKSMIDLLKAQYPNWNFKILNTD